MTIVVSVPWKNHHDGDPAWIFHAAGKRPNFLVEAWRKSLVFFGKIYGLGGGEESFLSRRV